MSPKRSCSIRKLEWIPWRRLTSSCKRRPGGKEESEEFVQKEVGRKEERIQLQRGCVEEYEEGFVKAMRQALLFSPDLEQTRFDIDKEVVDGAFVDD